VWQGARGATQYRVEWDAGTGIVERLPRAVVSEPRYVDDRLLPGGYRYWVTSEGPGGTSAPAFIEVHIPADFKPTPTPRPTRTPTATARSTIAPSPTPSGTTQAYATTYPTLTPTPEADDMVVMGLLSHSDFVDPLGDIHVVGEVRNETDTNLDHISVRVMFYNHWGTVSKIVDGPALMDVIGPRQLTPFGLTFPEPVAWESYTIRVTAQPTKREPVTALQIAEHRTYGAETGILHVAGTVVNDGEQTVQRAQVVVTLYDPWGTVVNAGFAYTEAISPGEEAAFDCQFAEYALMETVAVQVEAD
jgi:hypothetical protein